MSEVKSTSSGETQEFLPLFETVRDAIHHDIELDEDEMGVINTREYQRLRRIRQLGLAYLLYPCATHTRYEHSLGVCHMAQRIIDRLNRRSMRISAAERKVIRYAALLHDVGHLPFGHTLEDERPVISTPHDGYERLNHFLHNTQIGTELEKVEQSVGPKDLRAQILTILCATKKNSDKRAGRATARQKLFGDIIANTICADLLDYLKRDTLFTGIQHRYDERIIAGFDMTNDEIFIDLAGDRSVRRGLLNEILHMLRLRYTLGERVYYHQTKTAASAMISKAVELLDLTDKHLIDLGDEEVLFLMEHPEVHSQVFAHPLQSARQDKAQAIARLLRRGALYKPVYRISAGSSELGDSQDEFVKKFHAVESIGIRQRAEAELTKACRLDEGDLIIYCPDSRMSLKAAEVKVRMDKEQPLKPLDTVKSMPRLQQEIHDLHSKHEELWSFDVLIDPEKYWEHGARAAAACKEKFSLNNEVIEYRDVSGEAIALRALRVANEKYHGDFKKEEELLKAMHLNGNSILTAEGWKEAFPENFTSQLSLE